MVSPTRLTDRLVLLGLDANYSDDEQLHWNFGRKGGGDAPRYCLRFERSTRSTFVCVARPSRLTDAPRWLATTPRSRYWSWATPAKKHAELLFAMLPPEEVARATAFTLGVAYGQP